MDFRGILKPASQKITQVWIITLAMAFSSMSWAATQEELATDSPERTGLIDVEFPASSLLPYRERRPTSQLTVDVMYENYLPSSYLSNAVSASSQNSYADVYGDTDIPMASVAIGWKYNTPFAGVEVAPFYGQGGLIDGRVGEDMDLTFHKYGARFGVYFDTLFKEPYVVPFATAQAEVWKVEEAGATKSYSKDTGVGTAFQFGLLIQLNWIEPEGALEALNETGLNNTYLSVFAQMHGDPTGDEDPLLQSEVNWGAGLRLEY